jgi:hypothetical protein
MTAAALRTTNIIVVVDGNKIQGLLHAYIATTDCFSSDSFTVTFPIGTTPLLDLDVWSSMASAYVEISATTGSPLTTQSLITGMADTIIIDPIRRTATIEGRDLSSTMIDSYRQQDFVNQTASEVVSAIARNHGLTASVQPTTGSVGRYYGDGYTRLSLGQFSRLRSDWDVVVQLARENDFDVFVENTTLFFQPSTRSIIAPIPLSVSSVQRLSVEAALTITSTTSARLQSWNSQTMTSYDSSSAAAISNGPQTAPPPENQAFLFGASNLTSQQVTDSASRYTAELTRLAKTLHFDMPWNLTLSPRSAILLNGTNSSLDTNYKIDRVERYYNEKSGSFQTIRAIDI